MLRRISIAELAQMGVTLQPDEVVAIAQELIRQSLQIDSAAHEARPPFGPPTPANVYLARDGSVSCVGCDATLAVSEIAIFLQAVLPMGTAHVPGSLRYTVARALLDVDAPPFDSLEDFSRALTRHERGNRQEIIRRLFERTSMPVIERRRADPAVADLRRQLRDADARVYDQQLALDAIGTMMPLRPASSSRRLALAAGLAIGLAVSGFGEAIHLGRASRETTAEAARASDPVPVTDGARPLQAHESGAENDRGPKRAALPTVRDRPAARHAARASAPTRERSQDRRSRFRWLRSKITFRSDPL